MSAEQMVLIETVEQMRDRIVGLVWDCFGDDWIDHAATLGIPECDLRRLHRDLVAGIEVLYAKLREH